MIISEFFDLIENENDNNFTEEKFYEIIKKQPSLLYCSTQRYFETYKENFGHVEMTCNITAISYSKMLLKDNIHNYLIQLKKQHKKKSNDIRRHYSSPQNKQPRSRTPKY
jgi:hypothetical protein